MLARSSRRAFAADGRNPRNSQRSRVETGGGHRGDRGAGAGNRHHGKPRVAYRAHEPRAGIADGRRAGVADERDAFPGAQLLDDAHRARRFVVLVERHGARRDAVVPQEHAGDPRILGRDRVRAAQDVDGTKREIAQISERCRNDI